MRTPRRTLASVAALLVLAVPAAAGAQTPSPSTTAPSDAGAEAESEAEAAALTTMLDAVMASLPETACLDVSVDGHSRYRHDGDKVLVPASNQKVLTAAVALDVLGSEHRFRTRVVAGAAPVDGRVEGDLFLVGSGDPLLTTTTDRFVRRIGDDQHPTSLEELADRVRAAGITHVAGRIVGDETRYDTARTVATWPERYVTQAQSGPLSALTVADGYHYDLRPDEDPIRERDDRPALSAATTFTAMLQARGIQVGAFPGEGAAPAEAPEVAAIESVTLKGVTAQLLTFSDNQTGELLLKEIGRAVGKGGTTDAGLEVVRERGAELGYLDPGSVVADGSGLDPANQMSCDQLIRILDAAGSDSVLSRGLAVAGRTGTLARRLTGPDLAGRVLAKTGTLRDVGSLAGFVPIASGEVATFSVIVNGESDGEAVWASLTGVLELLARYRLECADPVAAPLVLPTGLYAGGMGSLAMFPLQSAVLPGTVVPLRVFEDRYRTLVDRCVAEDEDFGIVLISRGREVGGGDERTDVGVRVRILGAEGLGGPEPIQLLGAAVGRLKVLRWLDDDPHPWADVEDWPDPEPGADADTRLDDVESDLRLLLALRRDLGDPGPAPDVPIDRRDPLVASWALAHHTPVSAYDRQRLLLAPDLDHRLDLLVELIADERAVAEARLRGT
jgi:D-alanyl-D-alanine carboxypeptidase/D-alanyl-D-alanine-endopeptidase (penicillin-binding protein 4)